MGTIFELFIFINIKKQECIPVGCVLPTLYHTRGLPDRDPPSLDRDPPGQRPLNRDSPWTETPRQRPPAQRITDRCKNITFPQLCLRAVIIIVHAMTITIVPANHLGCKNKPLY